MERRRSPTQPPGHRGRRRGDAVAVAIASGMSEYRTRVEIHVPNDAGREIVYERVAAVELLRRQLISDGHQRLVVARGTVHDRAGWLARDA
jgi:hypothetical protein